MSQFSALGSILLLGLYMILSGWVAEATPVNHTLSKQTERFFLKLEAPHFSKAEVSPLTGDEDAGSSTRGFYDNHGVFVFNGLGHQQCYYDVPQKIEALGPLEKKVTAHKEPLVIQITEAPAYAGVSNLRHRKNIAVRAYSQKNNVMVVDQVVQADSVLAVRQSLCSGEAQQEQARKQGSCGELQVFVYCQASL